jgi:hypothetical protein
MYKVTMRGLPCLLRRNQRSVSTPHNSQPTLSNVNGSKLFPQYRGGRQQRIIRRPLVSMHGTGIQASTSSTVNGCLLIAEHGAPAESAQWPSIVSQKVSQKVAPATPPWQEDTTASTGRSIWQRPLLLAARDDFERRYGNVSLRQLAPLGLEFGNPRVEVINQ